MQLNSAHKSIGIIGAGITGLTLALALKKAGHRVTLWESSNRCGGAVITRLEQGYLCEEGPNSLLIKSSIVDNWIRQWVSEAEICPANPLAKRRYIVRDAKAHPLPDSLWRAVRTPLYSTRAKLRLLGEPFRNKSNAQDESVASFVRRRMGPEFLDYGIACLVRGIFAGDPDRISVRHAFPKVWNLEQQNGSLIRGAIQRWRSGAGKSAFKPQMLSFHNGLETLTRHMARELGSVVQTSTAIEEIEASETGWQIRGSRMGEKFQHSMEKLVITVPQHQLAGLPISSQNPSGEAMATALKDLPILNHPPLSTLVLGFDRKQIAHPLDGFGMLIPSTENRFILGSIFSSSLFPNRAPQGQVSLMQFIGGVAQPELAERPEAELIDRSCRDLRDLIGLQGPPVFSHHKLWKQAIPQYQVGHGLFIDQLEKIETQNPGIHFQGNYRGGPGLSDCMENALKLAESLSKIPSKNPEQV